MGGVIYIGDRCAGKTHLTVELANPNNKWLDVITPTYDTLLQDYVDPFTGMTKPTDCVLSVYQESLEVRVQEKNRSRIITSSSIDTPGEIWRKSWQRLNPDEWNRFLDTIRKTDGILLILSPYREIINKSKCNPNQFFINRQQWINRFQTRVDFFSLECPQIRHLCICMNKVDLLFQDHKELEAEAKKLAYDPFYQKMNWQEKHEYVYFRYFAPLDSQIMELNRNLQGLTVRCFITSIYNRELLELPWIYLLSYLGSD